MFSTPASQETGEGSLWIVESGCFTSTQLGKVFGKKRTGQGAFTARTT